MKISPKKTLFPLISCLIAIGVGLYLTPSEWLPMALISIAAPLILICISLGLYFATNFNDPVAKPIEQPVETAPKKIYQRLIVQLHQPSRVYNHSRDTMLPLVWPIGTYVMIKIRLSQPADTDGQSRWWLIDSVLDVEPAPAQALTIGCGISEASLELLRDSGAATISRFGLTSK